MMVHRAGATIRSAIRLVTTTLLTFCALSFVIPTASQAVPHVVSETAHPFDPDWPQVFHILSTKCVACHLPTTERLDFTSYESLVAARLDDDDDMRAIVPGDLEASLVWEYVSWNAGARRDSDMPDEPMMPPVRHEWLTEGQLAALRRWIERGALQYKLPSTCNIRPLMEMDFPSAKQCAACHPKQYDEWSRSMHAYGQLSPIFEAFNLTLIERTGGTIGTFCTR